MRPVGAVTIPLAMKSDKMDNTALNISTTQEKRLQLLTHVSEGNKATGWHWREILPLWMIQQSNLSWWESMAIFINGRLSDASLQFSSSSVYFSF
ncbi:hypothetical protein AMECASPLE_006280 [Ameca splendens]|uniref:Uncharacterized protein n=1 Tax=Ameca splendens TaxID=208324 RepID=A0ABV0YLG1_9TELE